MEGYIIAHFIFALSSRRSSKFLSKSFKIFHNKPVFSPTQTRLIVRGSKTSGNLFIDWFNKIPWSIFSFISLIIFLKYGFFVCLISIARAHLTSNPEFTKIENLFINCQTSFFETHPKRTISFMEDLLHFFSFSLSLFAFSRSFNKLSLLKFQKLS